MKEKRLLRMAQRRSALGARRGGNESVIIEATAQSAGEIQRLASQSSGMRLSAVSCQCHQYKVS